MRYLEKGQSSTVICFKTFQLSQIINIILVYLVVCNFYNIDIMAETPLVKVSDQSAVGVSLIGPYDPRFDKIVGHLVQHSSSVEGLKPYLVILHNVSRHTVIAYSISWDTTFSNKPREIDCIQFKYPDGISRLTARRPQIKEEDRQVRPSEMRLVGRDTEFGKWVEKPEWKGALIATANDQAQVIPTIKHVNICLDAVIFDSGLIVGPDRCSLREAFVYYLRRKQNLYRKFLDNLSAGQTVDEAFKRCTALPAINLQTVVANPLTQFDRAAVEDLIVWGDYYGRKRIAKVVRGALLRSDFSVYRETVVD